MQIDNNHVGMYFNTREKPQNHEDVKSVVIIERKPLFGGRRKKAVKNVSHSSDFWLVKNL